MPQAPALGEREAHSSSEVNIQHECAHSSRCHGHATVFRAAPAGRTLIGLHLQRWPHRGQHAFLQLGLQRIVVSMHFCSSACSASGSHGRGDGRSRSELARCCVLDSGCRLSSSACTWHARRGSEFSHSDAAGTKKRMGMFVRRQRVCGRPVQGHQPHQVGHMIWSCARRDGSGKGLVNNALCNACDLAAQDVEVIASGKASVKSKVKRECARVPD
eukprot:363453-Chlamydomonas_euryale.AAC.7